MGIILVSANGTGAGKDYLADFLTRIVGIKALKRAALADNIRAALKGIYPDYDWYNLKQSYKDNTIVAEYDGKSVRDVMIHYGQAACLKDKDFWVKRWFEVNGYDLTSDVKRLAFVVPDVRKVSEVKAFRKMHPEILHLHVHYTFAKDEPYEGDKLAAIADYVLESPTRE